MLNSDGRTWKHDDEYFALLIAAHAQPPSARVQLQQLLTPCDGLCSIPSSAMIRYAHDQISYVTTLVSRMNVEQPSQQPNLLCARLCKHRIIPPTKATN